MAGASDKARFYLEQSVPELQGWEKKGVFSREEITAITSKRSDFEHKLNARGSKPEDYARYIDYENNLHVLCRKRCERMGIKESRKAKYNGQKIIFHIFDRGTRKFPGDLALWMQYIEYCKREKAHQKLAKAFTAVLRLKPTEHELWALAARWYAEEQGDMSSARSYLRRGLRFCNQRKELLIEFARLEAAYREKLKARRRILGVDKDGEEGKVDEKEAEDEYQWEEDEGDEDEDMIKLPKAKAKEKEKEKAVAS
ncbi:hypothetical protein K470DRAFT_213271 [Piedraia hortae CBS 480.64]|uniref:U3 small nucleolar RNA-associated protein 6 N-terminal domain-containing protein n=1 Tax=Piedraia hortae CBS 480.64 TaxID=1314780 RepID=A0A6A7C4E7_9PEZI|nr:hypothetical protein K470DRAFT_213271 [Piedraia hortae CBS 480.64]